MPTEHLDQAMAEEFSGHAETIHKLKMSNPEFKSLMVRNHAIWTQIRNIQSGLTPADDAYLTSLEKQRLKVLDELAAQISAAES